MDNYKHILSRKLAGHSNIYVDKDTKELLDLLFPQNAYPFKFIDFDSQLKLQFEPYSVFIIYSSFLKFDRICILILEHKLKNIKIISFPNPILNYQLTLEQYGISNIVTYKCIPVGFYLLDGVFKIGTDSNENLHAALEHHFGNKKYHVTSIGGNANVKLEQYHDPESTDLFLVVNRELDLLSTVVIDGTFRGYVYELYGKKMLDKLKNNNLYKRIKDLEIGSANKEIKEESKRLQDFKLAVDQVQNVNDSTRMKLIFIKQKDELAEISKVALELDSKFSLALTFNNYDTTDTLNSLTTNQIYIGSFYKLMISQKSIIPEINNLIDRKYSVNKILRLLCLQSQVFDGISKKNLDDIKHSIVQVYGHKYIVEFNELSFSGLLKEKQKQLSILKLMKSNKHKLIHIVRDFIKDIKWTSVRVLFNGGIVYWEIDELLEYSKMEILTNKIIYPL